MLQEFAGSYFVTASEAAVIPYGCKAASWIAAQIAVQESNIVQVILVWLSGLFLIHSMPYAAAGPLILVGKPWGVPQLKPFME